MLKSTIVLILLALNFNLHAYAQDCRLAKGEKLNRDWAFFDLGNTIVDTRGGEEQFKYIPGALEYLAKLKKSGYRLGLISNIPVEWGKTFEERFAVLRKDIKDNLSPELLEFDWKQFDKIYLPAHEREYKPASYMFEKAIHYAKSKGAKRIYFQGENAEEVKKAFELGMISQQIIEKEGGTEFLACSPL